MHRLGRNASPIVFIRINRFYLTCSLKKPVNSFILRHIVHQVSFIQRWLYIQTLSLSLNFHTCDTRMIFNAYFMMIIFSRYISIPFYIVSLIRHCFNHICKNICYVGLQEARTWWTILWIHVHHIFSQIIEAFCKRIFVLDLVEERELQVLYERYLLFIQILQLVTWFKLESQIFLQFLVENF